ncbi:hypothetical protein [Methylocaldum szegediense]|jgi:hypothetical protein|uniref:Uncharacterized protein n=1 Tax=Methylocaldum szegediense TaxID=73780 RepID=A0ABM9HYQ7_9GAMM|nr:hypothetical protein [Methylocaldum szegediense]CAI8775672.1 conserved membrane protein of unknown function [Methylocaldum szegediense]
MSDVPNKPNSGSKHSGTKPDLQPGLKPLLWFGGGLIALIAFADLIFDLTLSLLDVLWNVLYTLVEGSEELFIEDKLEDWFDLSPRHAELITAWTLTPLKILFAIFALRWLWRYSRTRLIPALIRWTRKQLTLLRLSWSALWWPWKGVVVSVLIGSLFVLV